MAALYVVTVPDKSSSNNHTHKLARLVGHFLNHAAGKKKVLTERVTTLVVNRPSIDVPAFLFKDIALSTKVNLFVGE